MVLANFNYKVLFSTNDKEERKRERKKNYYFYYINIFLKLYNYK